MGKVNYSLVQRRNPVKKDAPKLFYASAQKTGDLTYEEIQKSISSRTTATPGDVSCVIESLLADIAAGLKAGKSVFLDKFGKFRLSLGSKGAATMKEFTTDMIRTIRIVFTPAKSLRLSKKDLQFELMTTKAEQKAALKAKMNGGTATTGGSTDGKTAGGDTTGGNTTGSETTGEKGGGL
jgi:predicted histone-like DNA-binding protein